MPKKKSQKPQKTLKRVRPPELTPEERAKVRRAKERAEEHKIEISEYWMTVSQFGYYYGYAGIEAIMDNKITLEAVNELIKGAEKMEAKLTYNRTKYNFYAFRAGKLNEKSADAFNRDTKKLREKGE